MGPNLEHENWSAETANLAKICDFISWVHMEKGEKMGEELMSIYLCSRVKAALGRRTMPP